MDVIDVIHWVHGTVFLAYAVFYAWSWARGGFWVPRYVHAIALVALIAGVGVTATLPEPTNPNPVVRLLFPLIFPVLFVGSTYAVAVLCGYVHLVGQLRNRGDQAEEQRAADEETTSFGNLR